jgi:hypothetical protein
VMSGSTPKAGSIGNRLAIFWQNQTRTIHVRKDAVQKGYLPANGTGERLWLWIIRWPKLLKIGSSAIFQFNGSELLISFADGSTMAVKIAKSNSPPLREGARIRQISEDRAKLLLECEDDSTLDVTIVDPRNSVIVRDKNGQVEYLG